MAKIREYLVGMTPEEAVKEYQCIGCVSGPFPDCYETSEDEGCFKHCAGTSKPGIGAFFLGMPKGFNRSGACRNTRINIFQLFRDGWGYDKFNVPTWKYLDNLGNTIVRGLSPRINYPFIHVFLGDVLKEINCLEITDRDMEDMD